MKEIFPQLGGYEIRILDCRDERMAYENRYEYRITSVMDLTSYRGGGDATVEQATKRAIRRIRKLTVLPSLRP
jgi:hypothetical protein